MSVNPLGSHRRIIIIITFLNVIKCQSDSFTVVINLKASRPKEKCGVERRVKAQQTTDYMRWVGLGTVVWIMFGGGVTVTMKTWVNVGLGGL